MSGKTHFRLCHVCGEVNAAENQLVEKCQCCGKPLAPFYYFDESRAMGLKTEAESQAEYRSSALPHREYPPIWGLTAYWD